MKTQFKILIVICLTLFICKVIYSQSYKISDEYWNKAVNLVKQAKYLEAAQMFERAACAEQKCPNPRLEELEEALAEAGYYYNRARKYESTIVNYEKALAIAQKIDKKDSMALYHNEIGLLYDSQGKYDKAIQHFQEALAINKELEKKDEISTNLNNIGGIYYAWGQFDKAILMFEEALAIEKELGREEEIAKILNNIGQVNHSWGKFDYAIENFKKALRITTNLGLDENIGTYLNNIGQVYYSWERYDDAMKYYEKALVYDRKIENQDKISIRLNNIGQVYESKKKYDDAIKCLKESLAIERKLGRKSEMAIRLSNMGSVYLAQSQYEQAVYYYKNALEISQSLNEESKTATYMSNIGVTYYNLEDYREAIKYFKKSTKLLEELRKTAAGDVKRDYLASQITTYQDLISAYKRNNDLLNTFYTIELSRAKLLAEKLAEPDSKMIIPSIDQIQEEMSDEAVILIYANVDCVYIVVIAITKDKIFDVEISDSNFVTSAIEKYKTSLEAFIESQDKVKSIIRREKKEELQGSIDKNYNFENLINYYRYLLVNSALGDMRNVVPITKDGAATNPQVARDLSRGLYDLLIRPMAKHIQGKTELIIVPDGILNFIPFETLIDENGKYLVEKFHIIYAPSIGVLELIEKRLYEEDRKPMLAFGGALYDSSNKAKERSIENDRQLIYLQ